MQAIEPAAFQDLWRAWYRVMPHGWSVLDRHADRWLRIHSLPLSKRLPDDETEYATILARHNRAIAAVVGTADCAVIGYDYAGAYVFPANHPLAAWLPRAPAVMRLAPEDEDSEPISVFAGRGTWSDGMLDVPLRAVADDHLRLMVLNWDTGAAYAPYDGGADLFWPTTAARDRARQEFLPWLSSDPSGL